MRKGEEYITRNQHDYDKLSLLWVIEWSKNCNAIYCLDVRDQKTHCAPVLKAEQVYMCTVQFSKTKSGKTKVIS